jgi:carboxypeptidase family protein/TonB-dependent receptor-like protein
MRTGLVILALVAIGPMPLGAQQVAGDVVGRVLTPSAQPVPGTTITATSVSFGLVRSTFSDARGYFHMAALPSGSYTILVRQVGYRPVEFRAVIVQLGRTTTLGDVKLEDNPVELPEIVVMGDRPLIDPSTTTAGGNLTSQAFGLLPVDRNFRSMVSLFPSANSSFLGDETNIGGATGQENAYYIDGVNVTDPYKARTSTNMPYDFVREVQVKTGGYEAEFGRALSGIVNVVTESGDNEFRGKVFGSYTGSGLASVARHGLLEADISASSGYDLGTSVGGPLRRDRLWFFASYDFDRLAQDVPLSGFGTNTDQRTAHLFAGKLTWRPDARTDVWFTLLGDPTTHNAIGPAEFAVVFGTPTAFGNVDPVLGRIEEGGVASAVQGRRLIGRRALIEVAAARSSRSDNAFGETDRARNEPTAIDVATGVWSGGYGVTHKNQSVRTSGKVTGAIDVGSHTLKAGIEMEDNRLDLLFHATDPGIIFRDSANRYRALYIDQAGTVRNRVVSAFLQDSWKLTDAVRFNAGLRWEGEYIVGADGRRAQSVTDQFAPRIGVIWSTPTPTRQTFSASYARFYEQLPTWFATNWMPSRNGFYFYHQDPLANPVPDSTLDFSSGIPTGVAGLRGQHLDEWALNYERLIGSHLSLGVRGVHRALGEVIENGAIDPTSPNVVGNPGRGNLSFLPRLTREYNAIELTLERRGGRRTNLLASYVLSRSYGNYTGLFESDVGLDFPNTNVNPDFPQQVPNSTGLLPNDRRHVLKASGSWLASGGLTAGVVITWASGTPLSELGAMPNGLPAQHVFLRPRGTVGRTPALLDLNVRLSYVPAATHSTRPTVRLDLFHVLSARQPVTFDQIHYLAADAAGNQSAPNPNYLKPTRYQPPMSARLGLEVSF